MAVLSDPTIEQIITEGLKRGGRPNPTTNDITLATTHMLREINADIVKILGLKIPELRTQGVSSTVAGVPRYAWLSDIDLKLDVTLVDPGSTSGYRDTMQAGSTSSLVVLSTNLNEADTSVIIGKLLITTGGTGSGQFGYLTSWNNSNQQAGIYVPTTTDNTLATTPDNTTTYIVGATHTRLGELTFHEDYNRLSTPTSTGIPTTNFDLGREIYLYPPPDAVYGLLWTYYADLDRIDRTGALYTNFLREYYSVFVQGIAVKTCQRFDEDRYTQEVQIYHSMLNNLGGNLAEQFESTFEDVY